MTRTLAMGLLCGLALMACAASPAVGIDYEEAQAPPLPSSSAETGDAPSLATHISTSGRFALVVSTATDLVRGQVDTPSDPADFWLVSDALDTFLYDRQTGALTLVSHVAGSSTTAANAFSFPEGLSANGNYVVFSSSADDLVPGQVQSDSFGNVFSWSRSTGETVLVSHALGSASRAGDGQSLAGSTSQDGRYVAFESSARDLVAGDTGFNYDVFLWDRLTGKIRLVSQAAGAPGTPANRGGAFAEISKDGAYVVFASRSTNLVAGQRDGNDASDVFLWERATGKTTLISHVPGSATTAANRVSYPVPGRGFSGNGRYVAFYSRATNLVAGQRDANAGDDVFLWERATGRVTLVSHAASGLAVTGNGNSALSGISADGAYVTFVSVATNLVSGQDPNGDYDLFLWVRASGKTRLVSHAAGATTIAANGKTSGARMSADGNYVAFGSEATDLVAGVADANARVDAFLWERATDTTRLVSHSSDLPWQTAEGGSRVQGGISSNGSFVMVESTATDLVPGVVDGNDSSDAFIWERAADTSALVSGRSDSTSTSYILFPGRFVQGLAYHDGSLWATHSNPNVTDVIRITKLDPETGAVLRESSDRPWNGRGITVALGDLWVADAFFDVVRRINPADFTQVAMFPTPGSEPTGITFDGSALWLADPFFQQTYRLSTTGSVLDTFFIPNDGRTVLEWEGNGMWTNTDHAELSFYTTDGVITATRVLTGLTGSHNVYDIAIGGGKAFIANGDRIDIQSWDQ